MKRYVIGFGFIIVAFLMLTGCARATTPPASAQNLKVTPASPFAVGTVRISGVQWQYVGDVMNTTVRLQNDGAEPVEVGGWKLQVGQGSITIPAGAQIPANQFLKIHTVGGESNEQEIYLGQPQSAFTRSMQPNLTLSLIDGQGQTVSGHQLPKYFPGPKRV